jgi:AcrR family transcriptional regulator
MAKQSTEEKVRASAKHLFATFGYEGVSMRTLSKDSDVGLSSIYHFFADKDVLLEDIYRQTNRELGNARSKLSPCHSAHEMLAQLIDFQFEHIEDIVYVLKYYLHYRDHFAAQPTRTLPAKSVLHIEEVIQKGIETGEYKVGAGNIEAKARVVSHTINGYLLEYYPDVPNDKERQAIVNEIVSFATAGLA